MNPQQGVTRTGKQAEGFFLTDFDAAGQLDVYNHYIGIEMNEREGSQEKINGERPAVSI